jgi:hypothetical protein
VRFLGVERENLEGHLNVRDEQGDDGSQAELLQCLQAVIAVRRELFPLIPHRNDRVQEAADLSITPINLLTWASDGSR